MEFEIKNTIPFRLAPKMNLVYSNLTKKVQDLYSENYKLLERKSMLMIERLSIVKKLILPILIYTFNAITIKSQQTLFSDSKVYVEWQKT